jgi:hypothetical protein
MINILYGTREGATHPSDDEFIGRKYFEWTEALKSRTVFAHKLKDGEGRTLSLKNGKPLDGPYSETKESVGGFYIVEASSYADATELAKGCPTLLYQGGAVEVREVEF